VRSLRSGGAAPVTQADAAQLPRPAPTEWRGASGEWRARRESSPLSTHHSPDPKCTCQLRDAAERWLAAGKPNVSGAEAETRLAACKACQHWSRYGERLALSIRMATLRCPLGKWDIRVIPRTQFVTTAQLIADTQRLVARLSRDFDAVVGVARSGLLPATVAAIELHLPLYACGVLDQGGLVHTGFGHRLAAPGEEPHRILVLDDTAAFGKSMKLALQKIHTTWPNVQAATAVIYSTPEAIRHYDYVAASYPLPHYLEWNFVNAWIAEAAGFDFDGILCEDIRPEDCDQGLRYEAALRYAVPKYVPSRAPVPLIATARLERYRSITEEWLTRHKVRWGRLVMGPWQDERERDEGWPRKVAEFKAQALRESGLNLFIESDPVQAEMIYRMTGIDVLCPAGGKVFSGW
jgi:hypoxanthine phosphoribosyltransferase